MSVQKYKKIFTELSEVHKIKFSEIRKVQRKKNAEEDFEENEFIYSKGDVYGLPDSKVKFDGKRNEDDYKDALRPVCIMECINDNQVLLIPGTGTPHYDKLCLRAGVPPEKLKKTTYFLLYFSQSVFSKSLKKKICRLSPELIKQLEIMESYE